MVSPDVVASVEAERAKAVQIVEACDVFLRAFAPAPAVVAAYVKPAKPPKPMKARAAKVAKPAHQPPVVAEVASDGSKVARYAAAIVKALQHYSLAPHHCADRAELAPLVAKACGVDPKKDETFSGDLGNALFKLKRAGTIERTGTVWALVEKPA